MKPSRVEVQIAAALITLAVSGAASGAPGPDPRRVTVAIVDVRAAASEAGKADLVVNAALKAAAAQPSLSAIRGTEACGDDLACLARVGSALGADYLLVGSLRLTGGLYIVYFKLVDARTGLVRARAAEAADPNDAKLLTAAQAAVKKLVEPLASPVAPAATATPTATRGSPPHPDSLPRGEGELSANTTPSVNPERSAAGAKSKDPDLTPSASGSGRRGWAYLAGSAGLAVVAGGALAALSSRSSSSAALRSLAIGDVYGYTTNQQSANRNAVTAGVLLGVGALGLGTGAYLYFTAPSGTVALSAAPLPGGGVAAVTGAF